MKAERSDFTGEHRGFRFLVQAFKEITQKLFQICLTPWKNNTIRSFSFQSSKSILSVQSRAKLTSKKSSDAISIHLFCRMKLFKVIHLAKRKIS